ncbi:MAG: hypothetical protein ACREFQ_23255, partial [Stellaceae bacterium]
MIVSIVSHPENEWFRYIPDRRRNAAQNLALEAMKTGGISVWAAMLPIPAVDDRRPGRSRRAARRVSLASR